MGDTVIIEATESAYDRDYDGRKGGNGNFCDELLLLMSADMGDGWNLTVLLRRPNH